MGRWLRHRPGGVGLRFERPARSRERPWGRRSVHRSAKMASRRNQAHTQSAPFGEARTQNAPFRDVEVASPAQNALFRRVRFSLPAQTWSHLTQRRILRRRSHVKAQSAPVTSRKGALCTPDLTEKRTLWPAHTQNALFRESDTPRMRLSVSCRLQSGVLVYTVATRFAEASTHTNPRRALKGQHWSIRER